jgi:predicted DNA binding CopG/RHH family protein
VPGKRSYTRLDDVELDEETTRKVEELVEQAEQDIAELKDEVQVNFRWSRGQLELVKRAAALHGVPYQTYLKQATIRQAITDLKDAAAAGVRR